MSLNFDELDSLLDEASGVTSTSEMTEETTTAKSNEVISYDILAEDGPIVVALKNYINTHNITTQELYDLKGQRDAYNMIYTLKKSQLGFKRLEEWCQILHINPVVSFVPMTDEEIKIAESEIKSEKSKKKRTPTKPLYESKPKTTVLKKVIKKKVKK